MSATGKWSDIGIATRQSVDILVGGASTREPRNNIALELKHYQDMVDRVMICEVRQIEHVRSSSLRFVGILAECMRPRLPHTLCSHTTHLAPVPSTGTKVCRPYLYTRAPSFQVLRSVLGLYPLHPSYHNQARDYEGRTFHYHSKVSLHLNHPSYDIQKVQ